MKYMRFALGLIVVVGVVGCGRMDERAVYRIACEHAEQQLGEGVTVGPIDEAMFAVGKNAARVDINYARGGADPIDGYMTVWCKRIRLRWELDRSTDSRNQGTAVRD